MNTEDLLKVLSERTRILEERSDLLKSIVATFHVNMNLHKEGKIDLSDVKLLPNYFKILEDYVVQFKRIGNLPEEEPRVSEEEIQDMEVTLKQVREAVSRHLTCASVNMLIEKGRTYVNVPIYDPPRHVSVHEAMGTCARPYPIVKLDIRWDRDDGWFLHWEGHDLTPYLK